MIVYPALDLIGGKVVRLEKGDFSKQTDFQDPPELWIEKFEQAGATCLHLVDLSGAKASDNRQVQTIAGLVKKTKLKVQVGGGIRSLEDIQSLLDLGVERCVIGSLALAQPEVIAIAVAKYGESRLCIAVDAKFDGQEFQVMTHGWLKSSGQSLNSVIQRFQDMGVRRFLCTDIEKDGMMKGPSLELYRDVLKRSAGIELQASGGVSNFADLEKLSAMNVHSVVVGKAFLTEQIDLKKALPTC